MSENYRAANAAKAREARAAGADEKAAARLIGRGWTVLAPLGVEANGFRVPAQPVSPMHFKDHCATCRSAGVPILLNLNVPHAREERAEGTQFSYRCRHGHAWTCYLSYERQRRYYTDCPCDYCVARLALNLTPRQPLIVPANWSAA